MAGNRHHHLSEGERHQMYALRQQELSIREIAAQLNRSPSTISRELRRNGGLEGTYDPEAAHKSALRRRSAASERPYKLLAAQWESEVWPLLRKGWSPDQISGWLRANKDMAL